MKTELRKKINTLLFRELDPAFARRARIIAKELDITKSEHVVEVGCGRGFYEWFLPKVYPAIRMTAVDRKPEYLSQAKARVSSPNIHFQIDDAMNLSFKSNTFDRLLSTEVLEHLPDDRAALSEYHRVLKKNGVAIFTVPHANYPFLWDPVNWILEHSFGIHIPARIWFAAGIWADHVRLYTQDDLVEKCEAAGFIVENVWRTTRYCIPFEHFLLYGIGKNIVERGLAPGLNRFGSDTKPSTALSLIRSITYACDALNRDTEEKGVPVMNLIVKVRKS